MSATNRYMNFGQIGFTPAGGTNTPITGVQEVDFDEGVSTQKESADADLFPTVSVNDHINPTITLRTLDARVLYAQLAGQKGTLVVTIRDAYNGVTTSGGGYTITFSNCQIEKRSQTHRHRRFGTQGLTFGGISSDGSTHPIAIALL